MRNLLRVDMASGECRFDSLDPACAALGGRGLASMLVAAGVPPDANPLGIANKLVFAPGLLGGCACAASGRIAVACKSPVDGIITNVCAGGDLGVVLAGLNIGAIVVEGAARPGTWLQLVISREGAALFPSPAAGRNNLETMLILARETPEGCRLITIGRAGELCLPVADLAFGDPENRPAGHAGCGCGAVMGSKGLKAVIINPADAIPARPVNSPAHAAAARRFARELAARRDDCAQPFIADGCSPTCILDCAESRSDYAGPPRADSREHALAGWPGYAERWSGTPQGADDAIHCARFAALCGDAGVDPPAMAAALDRLQERGALPRRDAPAALALLETMLENHLADGFPPPCPETGGERDNTEPTRRFYATHTVESMLMDSLGCCLFATRSIMTHHDTGAAFCDMLNAKYGLALTPESMAGTAAEMLRAELAFAHPHPCCGGEGNG